MKILYVEKNEIDRELTARHLSRAGHQVDLALPSAFVSTVDDIPSFANPKELSDLVSAGNHDLLFLNRETFCDSEVYYSQLLNYLTPVLNRGYQGKVIVDTTGPQRELAAELPETASSIKVLGKPYSFTDLDQALE